MCRNQHVTMTDSNYQQVFNYFRHCYFLTQALGFGNRKPYVERINELFQETWYDFIWRTDLCSEVLVKMQAAKENLIRQSMEDISFSSKQLSGTAEDHTISDRTVILLAVLLVFAFIMISLIVKFIISSNLKSPSYCEQCTSEIDVRMMNLEPPKISESSSDGHVVYYETHFLTGIEERQKECSIPSQVHIKMCCSHDDCSKNPEIVMQKCKTHNKTSNTELCQNPRRRLNKDLLFCACQRKNISYTKIVASCFNFFKVKLCQECRKPLARTNSFCMTSSGVSMSDEFVPVFETVRQMRLENNKKKDKDSSKTGICKSNSTIKTE